MTYKLYVCFPLNFGLTVVVFVLYFYISSMTIAHHFFSGNILNFNVGDLVDLDIPRSFWSRLAGKYGNMFYWKEKVKLLVVFISHFLFFSLSSVF